MQILSVSQLNTYIKSYIDSNPVFSNLFIRGELSNFKLHSSGHCYMTLKDENSVIKAVMFRSSASGLKFMPENGMKVIVEARLSVYDRDGAYQLYINDMQPDGIGALHIQFNQLKEKLENEGLFRDENKKSIPQIPAAVGVVTSETGAAVRDILNILKRHRPDVNIILYPALVQGDGASESIVKGIKILNEKNVDVIIIGRGGGSLEDLWCFNEECVARAVFQSHVPVISAVGHETDFTISDFVADLRAPTPSAAAELCSLSIDEINSYLKGVQLRFNELLKAVVARKKSQFSLLKNNYFLNNPGIILENRSIRCDELRTNLSNSFKNKLNKEKQRTAVAVSKLDALSPLKIIKKGYAYVENSDNKIITSSSQLKKNDKISLYFADGKKECEVL
ncbi:MAG: exodeoxyribonuclease VII large subunit [Clostridia bacterium]|nr:exodeoxyribonuclease VII large subunit [Clostridia bacterium]